MPKTCLIIGSGIAGPVAALVLNKLGISCTIYELRETPSTIGGAVNLTPNALKLLKELHVEVSGCVVDSIDIFSYHSGSKLAELSFRGPSGHAMRVMRKELQRALLAAVEKTGVKIVYGAKLVEVKEGGEKVVAAFEDGREAEADFILGCDGMYSAVRMKCVEPERKPIYTGVSSAYATVDATGLRAPIHFKQTAVNAGRYGSLLTSYVDPERKRVYIAAVMQTAEQGSKEGWKARGKDHERTVCEVKRRYRDSAFSCLPELLGKVEEYTFYPVCKLEQGGKWSCGRVLLLGDAAHGMPPQGESTGLAIEDPVLLARVFQKFPGKPIRDIFEAYEKTRRPRIDSAYIEAVARWERVHDKSWFVQKIEEWFTWAYMWYKADTFEKSFSYDVRNEEIVE